MQVLAVSVHVFAFLVLATVLYLAATRLESKMKDRAVFFLMGACVIALGVIIQLTATTIEGGLYGTKIVHIGVAVMIPSIFLFIQLYFDAPMPQIINHVIFALGLFIAFAFWVPPLRGLFFENMYLYPQHAAYTIYSWGFTRGVLYPVARLYHVVPAVSAIILLSKKVSTARGPMRSAIIILIFTVGSYMITNALTIVNPEAYSLLLMANMPLVAVVSVLLYTIFFKEAMRENEKAVQLKSTINDMIASISHDLKTPLTVLSISLEKLLGILPVNSVYTQHTQVAYNKNLDLQRLVQNLIEVVRIESVQNLYNPEWLLLNDLLARAHNKYSDHVESMGLTFDVSGMGVDSYVYADPSMVWSVFDNIIYNAIRNTHTGGITVVATHGVAGSGKIPETDTIKITISDTGEGIAKGFLPHIFERFYKVESSRGTQSGESGLGLFIVKNTMEGFCGSVEIESEVGVGTSVILSFLCKNVPE